MKILITGKGSYVGTNVEEYLNKWPEKYSVDTMDMIDGSWREKSFAGYDVVYHVAGIAHSDSGKISEEKERLYRSINTDLTIEVAKKASDEGVKQFIFMSSAIVYGDSAPLGKKKIITKKTKPQPNNCYSDSKLQAELGLKQIGGEMKICILRPPMIYGRGSKGNYPVLAKFARKLPAFPRVDNMRSMLYIENLCEFVRLMIGNREEGIFWPQNKEYSNTTEIVKLIAQAHNKKIRTTRAFNWGLYVLRLGTGLVDKAFGSLVYDQKMSEYKEEYRLVGLEESIRRTERNSRKSQDKESYIMKPRALVLASVASMIDQFNMQNIQLLLDNGYQVEVACNCKVGSTISDERIQEMVDRLLEKNVPVIHVPIPRKISDIKGIKDSLSQVKGMCDENHYNILHCHSPIGSVIARLAAKDARKNGTRVIYTAHGFHFYKGAPKQNWAIFYPIEKYCSKITDALITINKEDYAFAKNHMNAGQVEYIPGVGIDTKKFRLKNFDKSNKRKKIGIQEDDFMILSVGELNANKNHEVIIKAIAKLGKENIHYFIAGKGDKDEYLMSLAEKLGVNLHLLGYRTDVVELLNTADVYAFPSKREGLSVALMEAMAAGLPCVVSKIRGNVDLIEEAKGGYLVDPEDVEGFAKGLEKLIGSIKASEFGKYNECRIRENDVSRVSNKMLEIYLCKLNE